MAVNAAVARNAQAYEKVNALKSMSREFAELPYWYAQLVPLGKLVFDGRDPDPGMVQMMVYQKGGHQTIFHLPPQGLRISLEELSQGLQALQKFSEADVATAGASRPGGSRRSSTRFDRRPLPRTQASSLLPAASSEAMR